MKPLLRICIFNILIAGMVVGCSGEGEVASSEPHTADHAVTQKDAAIEQINDTTDSKAKAVSDEGNKHVTRSADAHIHGDAELAIVLEKNIVTVELDTPFYNILGFERAPETEIQTKTVMQAELQLERSETLFTFNDNANCTAASNDSHVVLFGEDTHEEHEHEEGEHDDHDDEDAHEDHDDEDTHKDILVTYEFKCLNPAKLSNVRINLFEFFPELSDVDVTYLGPATQRQATVTRQQNRMDITP